LLVETESAFAAEKGGLGKPIGYHFKQERAPDLLLRPALNRYISQINKATEDS
jgi:hypothetical protein